MGRRSERCLAAREAVPVCSASRGGSFPRGLTCLAALHLGVWGSLAAGLIAGALALTAAIAPARAVPPSPRPGIDWPSFRGIRAAGVAEGYPTPARWSVAAGEHVRWRTPIAGLGHSSPIVWGDLVCVTTAVSDREDVLRVGLYGDVESLAEVLPQKWQVWCLDKRSGALRWSRTVHAGTPKTKRHPKATYANATLATDGERIVAFFGSEGLYAYDMAGGLRWRVDLGVLDAGYFLDPAEQFGTASSPIVHDGLVIVQADVQRDGFLAAFDLRDGRQRWRTPRRDVPTWSTPTVLGNGPHAQVVVNGWKHAGGYDLQSGREIWRLSRGGNTPVPTPIAAFGLVFLTSAQLPLSPIYGIRDTARGDITPGEGAAGSSEHIAWSQGREGSYMQTPIVYGDQLYVGRITGVLNAFEARTGVHVYRKRLGVGRGFTASAVAADGKLYYTSEDGDVVVVRAGPSFEILAENALGEIALATPAISEGILYFRTRRDLIAIGATSTIP